MKRIFPEDVRDVCVLSRILDLSLRAVNRAPLHLPAVHISKVLNLHSSELTRMRRLHRRQDYLKLVSPRTLLLTVRYMQEAFPTLVIYEKEPGLVDVRLYKVLEGRRLPRHITGIVWPASPFRRQVRPGTTKWFLQEALYRD